MCGIIYAESFDNRSVNNVIMNQYENQKNRGQEGFGLYDVDRNHLVRSTTEKGVMKYLKKHLSKQILFHHRLPTSTKNVKNACHPFSTGSYFPTNYVLVHNGWISNAWDLKRKHEELGITYHSVQEDGKFNDSEALLWDVALFLEGKQESLQARGPIAFICIATPSDGRKSKKLYFGRNTNPLNMLMNEDNFLFLSSEGEGEAIDSHMLYSYNYRSRKLDKVPLTILEREVYQPTTAYENRGYFGNWRHNDYPQGYLTSGGTWVEGDEDELDNEDPYVYMLIPNITYDYETIVESNEDYTWSAPDKTEINLSARIREKVRVYLEEGFGLYEMAAEVADDDLASIEAQIKQDEKMGFIFDEDLGIDHDITLAADEVIYSSPYWTDRNSIDPGYEAFYTEQQKLHELTNAA